MARGAWLRAVRFNDDLRQELTGHLGGHDTVAIIADLERVVAELPAFRRDSPPQSVRRTLGEVKEAAEGLRYRLEKIDEETENCLWNALTRLGKGPTEIKAWVDALGLIGDAVDVAEPTNTSGGRPRDLEATRLVEQVAETLKQHRVEVKYQDDGVFASILRALWPHALPNRSIPWELKYWFNLLKSQR